MSKNDVCLCRSHTSNGYQWQLLSKDRSSAYIRPFELKVSAFSSNYTNYKTASMHPTLFQFNWTVQNMKTCVALNCFSSKNLSVTRSHIRFSTAEIYWRSIACYFPNDKRSLHQNNKLCMHLIFSSKRRTTNKINYCGADYDFVILYDLLRRWLSCLKHTGSPSGNLVSCYPKTWVRLVPSLV